MNKLIKINGLKEIEGMKFHDIEGGFGEGKKAMLVRDIANIHGRDLKDINRNINNNISRFKKEIDLIDLKVGEYKSLSLELGYSNQSYANANNIYLLSERGYAKLLKILEDDIAWEQYEKLVDGYFNMREQAKKLSTEEILELQYRYTKEVKEEVKELKDDFNNFKGNSPLFNIECRELQALVRKTGIMHLGGYKSQAYRDNSLRSRVYADIQHQLKREFGVSRYEAIKRGQLDKAMELVNNYILPTVLIDEIRQVNNQINFKEVI